jgi:hypothetical protein
VLLELLLDELVSELESVLSDVVSEELSLLLLEDVDDPLETVIVIVEPLVALVAD